MNVSILKRYKLFMVLLAMCTAISCSQHGRSFFSESTILPQFLVEQSSDKMVQATPLTAYTSDELAGRLSPDGTFLAYAGNQKGNLDIWLLDLTTGIPERLTSHLATDTMPSFSPDGKSIVFISMRDDVKGDAYIMKIGSDPEKLTDRETSDSYPVFHPDGESIFLASGLEGKTRIVRYWLNDGRVEKLSSAVSTQPAVSPDGNWLVYVRRNDEGVFVPILHRLSDGKTWPMGFDGYQCGYPAFSPDSGQLYFSVFYYTRPNMPIAESEHASIWRVGLNDILKNEGRSIKTISSQITSGRYTHLFLQAHENGLIYSSKHTNNLDIYIQPSNGLIPEFDTAVKQLAFAESLDDPLDRLLAYRSVHRFPDTEAYQRSLYASSRIDRDNKWFDKQVSNLKTLDKLDNPIGNWQGLARVDLAVWDAEKTKGLEVETGQRLEQSQIDEAMASLSEVADTYADNPKVSAYALIREADMLYLKGDDVAALNMNETALKKYPAQKQEGIEAKIRLGEIFSRLNATDMQVAYYLTLFRQFPEFENWLIGTLDSIVQEYTRQISRDPEIKAMLNPPEFDADRKRIPEAIRNKQISKGQLLIYKQLVAHLRRLADVYKDNSFLASQLQLRIGRLYEKMSQLDLAVLAMENIAENYPDRKAEWTEAIFALGNYSIRESERLRKAGRYNESGAAFGDALEYYERITNVYPADNENHIRARKAFVSLALLKAMQDERDGDLAVARKAYRRILDVDPENVLSHRKEIFYGIRNGEYEQLKDRYEEMIDKEESSFIGHYGLGYLLTYQSELEEGDLDDAEEEIEYALSLRPQSPYPYITLGWIYEMRERVYGDMTSGWLEEAIIAYDKAFRLNDRGADLQSESDIMVNLTSVFSQMGNTWDIAFRYAQDRDNLKLPFLHPTREAIYRLNYGRAAFNLNRFDVASDQFESALNIANRIGNYALQAELIARLALNDQQQGRYASSTRYFNRAIKIYENIGKKHTLAALNRAIAFNHYYLKAYDKAFEKLNESQELLEKYGTVSPDSFIRLGGFPNLSLQPMGFDKRTEEDANQALRDLIYEDLKQLKSARKHLTAKYELMDQLLASQEDSPEPDLLREMSIINNRLGRISYDLGDDGTAIGRFKLAYMQREQTQSIEPSEEDLKEIEELFSWQQAIFLSETGDGELIFSPSDSDFSSQLLDGVSSAEIFLNRIVMEEESITLLLPEMAQRMDILAQRLDKKVASGSATSIRPDLIWRTYNASALLSLRYAMRLVHMPAVPGSDAELAISKSALLEHHLTNSIRYLKKVIQATAPFESEDNAEQSSQPVSDYMRARMHVQALSNLSAVAALFESEEKQQDASSRSRSYLNRASEFCSRFQLDDICLAVRMTVARVDNNTEAADKIISEYISLPTEMLGQAYLMHSGAMRRKLFSDAIALAINAKDYASVMRLVDLEAQRLTVDELAKSGWQAESREASQAFSTLRMQAKAYRQLIEGQRFFDLPPESDEEQAEPSQDPLAAIATANSELLKKAAVIGKQIRLEYSKLAETAPRLSRLLTIRPLTPDKLKPLLRDGDKIIMLVASGSSFLALSYDGNELNASKLANMSKLRKALRVNPAKEKETETIKATDLAAARSHALKDLIGSKLLSVIGSAKQIYVDTGRLSNHFPLQGILHLLGKSDIGVLRIASATGLREAYENRNLNKEKYVAALLPSEASSNEPARSVYKLAQTIGKENFSVLDGPAMDQAGAMPALDKGDFLIVSQPLIFEGKSAANAWLRFLESQPGLGRFHLPAHIDHLWKCNQAVFTDVQHTANRWSERIVLDRMLMTYGLPGYVLVSGEDIPEEAIAIWLRKAAPLWTSQSRSEAHMAGLAAAQSALPLLLGDAIQLYGYSGMNKEEGIAYAKAGIMPAVKRAIALQKVGANDASVEAYEQALMFIDYTGENKFLTNVLEYLVTQSRKIQDYERVLKYQHRILAMLEKAAETDKKQIVAVLNAKKSLAQYYAEAKRYDEALAYNQQILDVLLQAKRRALCGPYYSQRGLIFEMAKRFPESAETFQESLDIFRAAKNGDGIISESRNLARILRLRLSSYRRARKVILDALPYAEKASDYMRLLLRLGLARNEQALGNYQKTVDICKELIAESDKIGKDAMQKAKEVFGDKTIDPNKKKEKLLDLKSVHDRMNQIWGMAQLDLANTLWIQGDYAQALHVSNAGVAWAEKGKDIRYQIRFNSVRGVTYASLGNMEEAVSVAQKNIELAQGIGELDEVATASNNLGDAYRKWGRYNDARKAFDRAMEIDREQNYLAGLAFDYANIGLTLEQMQRWPDAISNLEKAIEICKSIGDPRNEVKSRLGLGRIYMKQNKLSDARKQLETGLDITRNLNFTEWEWKFLLQLGRLELKEGNKDKALNLFLAGIEVIEPLPPAARTALLGPKQEEDKSELYDEAMELLALRNEAEKAFALSERFRSRKFLDLIGGARLTFPRAEITELLAKEREIRNELRSLKDALVKAADDKKEAANKALSEKQLQYDSILADLAKADSELPSYVSIVAADYQSLQALIPDDVTLLSYYQTENVLIIFSLTKSKLRMLAQQQKRSDTQASVESFRNQLVNFNDVHEISSKLYGLLMAPVAPFWKDAKALVVIPHNALHYLPFGALWNGKSYLAFSKPISTLSSATMLKFADNGSGDHSLRRKLAVGMQRTSQALSLNDLPFTQHEIEAFSKTFPQSRSLTGKDATETAVKSASISADWIHIASHTQVSNVNPLDTALLLAPDDRNDGTLQLKEILALPLNSKLVSLSTCDSAIGPLTTGDEMIGLSRAFLTAGSQQVLASLWRVSDLSTAVLMKHFFRQMKKYPPAKALQEAQITVQKQFPHPAFWSGFRLEGYLN